MPAKSRAQQKFMAIAEHNPGALKGKKPDMSKGQLHDFAATPTKSLPNRVLARDHTGGQVLNKLAGG